MRNNAWLFGLIFIFIFVWAAWNNFQFPTLIIGKTKEAKATIFHIFIKPGCKGRCFNQVCVYYYGDSNNWYINHQEFTPKQGIKHIGSNLFLKYESSNPTRHNLTDSIVINKVIEENYTLATDSFFYELKLVDNTGYLNVFDKTSNIKSLHIGPAVIKSQTIELNSIINLNKWEFNLQDLLKPHEQIDIIVRINKTEKTIVTVNKVETRQ